MPVIKCSNGKWRIGTGPCVYKTKVNAERAWAAARAGGQANMKDLHYFISDVTSFPVTFAEQDDGNQLAQGIPIIRPGKYHGQTYTAEDLKQMAENFATIRDRDGFTPALKPRHFAEPDESLGPIVAVRFDEDKNTMVADAIVDETTVDKIQSGKYRYVSGEIDFEYELQTGEQENIGMGLEGAAFTLNPASRGMQIDAVLNAREFPQLFGGPINRLAVGDLSFSEFQNQSHSIIADWSEYRDTDTTHPDYVWVREIFDEYLIVEFGGKHYKHNYQVSGSDVTIERDRVEVKQQYVALQDTPKSQTDGGDKKMTVIEKWKGFVERLRKGEEVTDEEVVALAAEVEPEDTDGDGDDDKPTLDTDQISRQMRQLEKSNEDLRGEVTALNQLRMRDQCEAQVDELVRGGHVPPAQRQQVYLMLEKLSTDGSKLIVLGKDAEGEETTSEQTPLQVYVNTLKGMGLAEKTPEKLSGGFFEEEVLDEASEAKDKADADRMKTHIPKDQLLETTE